ncbi:MAG: 4Fe-4S binding protein [Bacteroidales bacterium]|nr:4Fe-4S binding protein [Bacteroidales bacterium]
MCSQDKNNNKNFLINSVLLNETTDFDNEIKEKIKLIKHDTTTKPVIYIGSGTCGLIAGAQDTIDAVKNYIYERKIDAEIIQVGCIGICSEEPLLDVQLPGKNRISFKQITNEKVNTVLDAIFSNIVIEDYVLGQFKNNNLEPWRDTPFIDELDFFSLQKRVVLDKCGEINPLSIDEYIANGGYKSFVKTIRYYTSKEICNIIEESGLRGRGGGGFPTGKKWKIAYNTPSEQRYLICNADESDPGAFMDRAIIEGNPHKLIEGIAIAAYSIRATKAYIYIRTEYSLAVKCIENAIEQAKEYGLIGHNIFDSGFNLDIVISKGAGAFVCGEETALINSIEGKRGIPRQKPPYPAVSGLFGKPTVVNNVETLANIPDIIDKGANWYNSIGTKTSKGTKVFAVTGKTAITGLVEVPMGTSVNDIIFKISGGIKHNNKFKAVQIGGPTGGCISEQNIDIPIDYEALKEVGAIMGSGGMFVMDDETCIVDVVKFFINFVKNESCGKCIPCREGTKQMYDILENITKKPTNENHYSSLERFKGITELESLAKVIIETSLCGLGQTAPNAVLNTLKYFREEYEEHIFDRKCRAGVCTELKTFFIDVDKCTGCTMCAKKCPVDAIIGSNNNPHFIIQDKCIGCGNCFDACKFGAVIIK